MPEAVFLTFPVISTYQHRESIVVNVTRKLNLKLISDFFPVVHLKISYVQKKSNNPTISSQNEIEKGHS